MVSFMSGISLQQRLNMVQTAFEITKIDGYIGVTPLKDEYTGPIGRNFTIGSEHIETEKRILTSGEYRLIWDPRADLMPEPKEEHGDNCIKCKKFYPHAIKSAGFTCWACKNGY